MVNDTATRVDSTAKVAFCLYPCSRSPGIWLIRSKRRCECQQTMRLMNSLVYMPRQPGILPPSQPVPRPITSGTALALPAPVFRSNSETNLCRGKTVPGSEMFLDAGLTFRAEVGRSAASILMRPASPDPNRSSTAVCWAVQETNLGM